MAASVKKMLGVGEESSSSSEDEQLKRCQEAVWETRTSRTGDDGSVKPSKRVIVADHEHDGNELQVTRGFQTHVAKKLGHFLDSHISETEASSCLKSAQCDDDEEGFRLFSTSVPGQKADEPLPPVRRRPPLSSSDSDSEMENRLKEAAVSIKDLLPSLCPPSSLVPLSAEPPHSEKKRKKKKLAEGSKQVESAGSPNVQSNGEHTNSEQEHNKVKRKKKKRREVNKEEALE